MHGASSLSERDRRLLHRLARRIETSQHRLATVPFHERLAEKLSMWAGSWVFIGCFLGLLVFWLEMNSHRHVPFDPFPYPALNLFLSILAPTQALLILMAQNRQTRRSRAHAAKEYAITLRMAVEVATLRDIAAARPSGAEGRLRAVEEALGRIEQRLAQPTFVPEGNGAHPSAVHPLAPMGGLHPAGGTGRDVRLRD
ncbi:DUF1003 domain-containing protein [Ancylobacter sp. sgz301288]